MNFSALRRVAWKEYRQLRALWLSVILLTVLLEGLVVLTEMMKGNATPIAMLYTIALRMPILYALGCGAMMFAGENESSTYAFLRGLPVSATNWHVGKLLIAVVSSLLLPPILWSTAWVICQGEMPVAETHIESWLGGVVMLLEMLVWASLFSLLLRRALWAAVMAGAAWLAVMFVANIDVLYHGKDDIRLTMSFSWRAIAMAVVLPLTFVLSRRWLREFPLPWDRPRVGKSLASSNHSARRTRGWPSTSVLGRLVWQQWRQSWWTIGAVIVIFSALACWSVWDTDHRLELEQLFFLPPCLAAVFGACTFMGDQRNYQYRFFSERGIGPRIVWLSRLIAWASPLLFAPVIISIFLVTALLAVDFDQFYQNRRAATHFELSIMSLTSLGIAVLCFTIGQACSMLIRSGILALLATIVCCGASPILFSSTMTFKLPILIALVPIPFVLLFATWLRAPHWILERNRWQAWLRVASSLLVPMMVVLVALVFYRNHEIPRVMLPFDPGEVKRSGTPQERQTAKLYMQALEQYESHMSRKKEKSTVAEPPGSPWIATFLEASERDDCWFTGHADGSFRAESAQLGVLSHVVLADALRLESAGDLDEAFQRNLALLRFARHLYQQPSLAMQHQGLKLEKDVLERLPHWAGRQGQTAQTIRDALTSLQDQLERGRPQWKLAIAGEYVHVRRLMLADRGEPGHADRWDHGVFRSQILLEKTRMLRFLDVYAAREVELTQIAVLESLAHKGVPPRPVVPYSASDRSTVYLTLLDRPAPEYLPGIFTLNQVNDWLRSTPALGMAYGLNLTTNHIKRANDFQLLRRVATLQLALIAWRQEHGQLPQSLEELVGNGLESLPVDPYTRRKFLYRPEGVDITQEGADTYHELVTGEDSSPGDVEVYRHPFLWSPGAWLEFAPGHIRYGFDPRIPHFLDFKRGARLQSEFEMWWHGKVYSIPGHETEASP